MKYVQYKYLQSRQDLLPDERMVGPGITKALLNIITVYAFISIFFVRCSIFYAAPAAKSLSRSIFLVDNIMLWCLYSQYYSYTIAIKTPNPKCHLYWC